MMAGRTFSEQLGPAASGQRCGLRRSVSGTTPWRLLLKTQSAEGLRTVARFVSVLTRMYRRRQYGSADYEIGATESFVWAWRSDAL